MSKTFSKRIQQRLLANDSIRFKFKLRLEPKPKKSLRKSTYVSKRSINDAKTMKKKKYVKIEFDDAEIEAM